MCDVSLCFVTFPYGALGQVWYLIVLIPDLCHLLYFYHFFRLWLKHFKIVTVTNLLDCIFVISIFDFVPQKYGYLGVTPEYSDFWGQ